MQSARTTCNIMSYKYGHLAAQAIESAINQRTKFDRIVFYDDGAKDCKHLPKIYPEVEFVLRPKNLGIIDNFNDALNRTETEQVMFLGADNWLHPTALHQLKKSTRDIAVPQGYKVTDSGYEYWEIEQPHGSSLYNVQMAKGVGGYAASGNEHTEEDSILFNKMKEAGATIEIINYPLFFYRWRHRKNYNQ